MAFLRDLREMSPLRQLLFAALVVVVALQAAAMAMLAQSQVQKAAARDAMERTALAQSQTQMSARDDTVLADGVMTVGYAPRR